MPLKPPFKTLKIGQLGKGQKAWLHPTRTQLQRIAMPYSKQNDLIGSGV